MIKDLVRLPAGLTLCALWLQQCFGALSCLHWPALAPWAVLYGARAALDAWALWAWWGGRDRAAWLVLAVDLAAGLVALWVNVIELDFFTPLLHPAVLLLYAPVAFAAPRPGLYSDGR